MLLPQGDGAGAADAGWAHQPGKGSDDHRPGRPSCPKSEAAGRGRKAHFAGRVFHPCRKGHGQPADGKRKRRSPQN